MFRGAEEGRKGQHFQEVIKFQLNNSSVFDKNTILICYFVTLNSPGICHSGRPFSSGSRIVGLKYVALLCILRVIKYVEQAR